ncbi:thiamine ABC transporter substrate-binding protein, partial [Georgenia sp. 10Sc9-8]|nr:thiamine ABC transporter substrate-binding protein [Georgenia halotolerans]
MTHIVHRTAALAGAVGLLTACSVVGQSPDDDGGSTELTLVTHDSFTLDEELLAAFEDEHGYELTQVAPGDAGSLVNQLVLTKDSPLGDVVYGIDNSFASRAVDEGVIEPYPDAPVPEGAEDYAIAGSEALVPVDVGDVCINVDRQWYAERDLAEPTSLEDLTRPEYADQLVVTNPATSSPGLSFLLATVGAFGQDGWQDYWRALADNGVTVVDGWSDAYYVDFTGTEDGGTRPLVVSYASSPAAEVPEDGGEPRTRALLDTCFRQIEYAGVLAGTEQPEAARELVDFLLSAEVQADIPTSMYMYPVDPSVSLPEEWAQHAPLSEQPHTVDPAEISEHREEWVRTWT